MDRLLAAAYARSEHLAPGSPQNLVLLGSRPDFLPGIGTDAVVGLTPEEVSRRLGPEHELFIVLDESSAEDETALLVGRGARYSHQDDDDTAKKDNGDDSVETVRIGFEEAQCLITSLEVATTGFAELQSIAHSSGGVLRTGPGAQRGGKAPRKMLGRER